MLDRQTIEVPSCDLKVLSERRTRYCIVIPAINEGARIRDQLARMHAAATMKLADVIVADGPRLPDTTQGFRAYSRRYLADSRVRPFRDVFRTYELLAYLTVRASQLGFRVVEVPTTRTYPPGKIPTKINLRGQFSMVAIL